MVLRLLEVFFLSVLDWHSPIVLLMRQDPAGNVIQHWRSLDSLQGMVTRELRVPHHPPFGMWKIQAVMAVRLNSYLLQLCHKP